MLLTTIQEHIIQALKSHETEKVETLRFLLADIKNQKIEKHRDLTDDEILSVIQKQIKRHTDSVEAFTKGNRTDLVEKEEVQMKILRAYLPEQMSDEEIKQLAVDAIQKINAISMKDMGRVMGEISGKIAGRADKSKIAAIVSSLLHSNG